MIALMPSQVERCLWKTLNVEVWILSGIIYIWFVKATILEPKSKSMTDLFSGKTVPVEDVLTKFDKIVIKPTDKISQSDRGYCERMQRGLDKLFAQLAVWDKRMREFAETEPVTKKYYSIKKYHRNENEIHVEKEIELRENNPDPFEKFHFCPLYDVVHCQRLRSNAIVHFVKKIESYFNSTYNLRLDIPDSFFDKKKVIHYELLVEAIVNQLGGRGLNEQGIEILKDEFRRSLWKKDQVTLSGAKLTITDYMSYYTRFNDKVEFNDGNYKLFTAITYFETGEAGDIKNEFSRYCRSGEEVQFGNVYEFHACDKIKSAKFFKNRKVELVFLSSTLAQSFFDTLELNKVPTDR